MHVGFAERDITPEKGMERPGGYGKAYHTGEVHDPCKVRAVVFDDGEKQVALVGLDTLMAPRHLVLQAREAIQEAYGLEPEAVLIAASHSHSAGPLGFVQPEYNYPSEFVQYLACEKSTCPDPRYVEHTRQQIVAAVAEAYETRVEAKCGAGSGHEDKVAFNRRFRMNNGFAYTHPGKGNPDIIEPAGPIDPEVGVIGVWDTENRFLGCVVNYACHATTGPGGTSADWIYYLEQTIRRAMGSDAIVVFLNGACGDVTQVNNLSSYAIDSGERSARFVGGRVGAEAVKVLLGAESGELVPVEARSKVLPIPRRRPSPERLRRALEVARRDPSECDPTEWTFAKEIVLLDALISQEPVVDVEVQAIQVGPAIFLANPAELFCQYGLDLKTYSNFPFTFPVELANGCIGYVPTEEAMGEHGGGYETRLTSYSNLVVSAGSQMVEGLLQLAHTLTPGEAPTYSLAGPFRGSWSYGNVPPELE